MDELMRAREKINKADAEMTRLFGERMDAVKKVAEYKAERALPIFDGAREADVIKRNSALIPDTEYKDLYIKFLENNMKLSRSYQARLYPALADGFLYVDGGARVLNVNADGGSYPVYLGASILCDAGKRFDLDRRTLVVTDGGVPEKYAQEVAGQSKEAYIFTVPSGEESKSLDNFSKILSFMAEKQFTRSDCVVAVGGGVVGDLAGFCAASYMRGIDFYNIPTTVLSQVDSSVGGKTAINIDGYKNTVGAFLQPKGVLIDTETLLTLDLKNVRAGLCEALKMALTSDAELFSLFESGDYLDCIEDVIARAILIKRGIVERDTRERGERKILNFGHTVGHAIESATHLLHGECVGIGMLPMCESKIRARLENVLDEMGLPTSADIDEDELYSYILRDKKASGDRITLVYVKEVGKAELIEMPTEQIIDFIKQNGGIQ